tara:strand:- start:6961 stop:7206 length:246 start_codon:yes stop_codon:yes gene_type:complete
MIGIIKSFFRPSEDKIMANQNAFYLADKVIELQEKVKEVQYENKCLRNNLSELQQKINAIQPVVYNISSKENLSNYSLGDK